MSIRKIGYSLFLGMGLGLLGAQVTQAQPTVGDVEAEIQSNAQTVMDFLNEPFAKSMGLFSSLGWNTPPVVFDLVAGPRIEIGVGVGAQLMNLPDLNSLSASVTVLPADVGVDLPTFIPIPLPVATGRVGLMNGLDAGLKVAYFPEVNIPEIGFAAGFTGIGVELRYKFIQGDLLPDVTVAVSYDSMQGSISVETDVDYTVVNYQSSGDDAIITGPTRYALDWDIQSFGAKLQVGKNLGALYPYASVGFQRHSGRVSSTLTGDFNINFQAADTAYALSAISASAPIVFEPKFVGGVDFGEGFIWGLVAESNAIDIAASTNFRLRF